MTYVTDSMRNALAEHRLRQVCNSGGVRVFRMAHPAGILAVDLIFMPEYTLVSAGERRNLRSQFGCALSWLVDPGQERDLCARFHDYDPSDAGWLCAIQQRFAELWRERVARIEAIVGTWEWGGFLQLFAGRPPASVFDARAPIVASIVPDDEGECRAWRTFGAHVTTSSERGTAESLDAAKLAARADVLRQAIENPSAWHCGEVDEW